MTEYIIEFKERGFEFPAFISIIKREIYEKEIGNLNTNNPNIKVIDKYPLELELRLRVSLGKPSEVGEKSLVFIVSKELQNCIKRMFNNLVK